MSILDSNREILKEVDGDYLYNHKWAHGYCETDPNTSSDAWEVHFKHFDIPHHIPHQHPGDKRTYYYRCVALYDLKWGTMWAGIERKGEVYHNGIATDENQYPMDWIEAPKVYHTLGERFDENIKTILDFESSYDSLVKELTEVLA